MNNKDHNTVCDSCSIKTWYETKQACHVEDCKGTLQVIDTSDLDPRFDDYHRSGQRIEVTYDWGETERFYVGKSTGWKPVYLSISKSNSSGGSALMASSIKSIRPLARFK